MEYIELKSMPYYEELSPLVEGMGYDLVSVRIEGGKSSYKVSCVIGEKKGGTLGVDDMAKVHRAILCRLEAVKNCDDIAMELSTPGIKRNVKNAAEFALFIGEKIKAYSKEKGGWIEGKIAEAAEGSKGEVIVENESGKVFLHYEDIAKAFVFRGTESV